MKTLKEQVDAFIKAHCPHLYTVKVDSREYCLECETVKRGEEEII